MGEPFQVMDQYTIYPQMEGLICAMMYVSGGTRIVALKSNSPKRNMYADNFGLHLDEGKRFKVRTA